MSVMPDRWIIQMATSHRMIEPFAEAQVRPGISYGVGSYGYDFRLASTFKIPRIESGHILDPKNASGLLFDDLQADSVVIPPGGFVLGQSVEYFRIPRNIITICFGKSTYARVGVIVNVTPFEPEWEGFATLSLINGSPLPVKLYGNEGVGQILFLKADEECAISYKDKKGKYQAQDRITLSKSDHGDR